MTGRDVATSSQAGAAALRGLLPAGPTCSRSAALGVREALQHQGFEVVTPEQTRDEPDLAVAGVLQGYGAAVTAADLAEAAYAVAAGAVWVATNTDATLPTHRGTAPGNGTLVAAVQRATGLDPLVVGKPHAPLYQLCAAAARGASPPRCWRSATAWTPTSPARWRPGWTRRWC